MSFTDVMGGFGQNFGLQSNLAQNTAMNQQNQLAAQQQQASLAAQQAQLASLYGPQGFGGQTANYAALGAAYGRGTGGFGSTTGVSSGGYNALDAAANDPASQAYFAAYPDVAASGMTAAQHYMLYGRQEGRSAFGLDATPGAFPEGGTTPFSPYGQPGVGDGGYLPGSPDFGGQFQSPSTPSASVDQRIGQIPGQPYYPGYFDNTFGAANSQPQQTGFSPIQTYGEPGTGQGGYNPADIWGGAAYDYANANPDVKAAFGYDPKALLQHYQTYGIGEGRGGFGMPAGGDADARAYLAANADVAAAAAKAGGDPLQYARWHESQLGKGEGRGWGEATGAFKDYGLANPDVMNAALHSGMDMNTFLGQHANQFGINEGRNIFGIPLSASNRYYAANPDVKAAGIDAGQHYQKFGHGEGREGFGLSFDNRFSAAPAVDYNLQGSPAPIPRGILTGDFNTQTPNSPSASFNERFGIFGDPTQGMNFTQQSQMPVPMTSRNWTFDSYGNPVPPNYGDTGGDMYSPGAYAPSQPPPFGGQPASSFGAPGSGAVGPYMDPFTSYPWNNTPAANIDYRFPQFDFPTQNLINQYNQGLNNIGGGSTLTPQDVQIGGS